MPPCKNIVAFVEQLMHLVGGRAGGDGREAGRQLGDGCHMVCVSLGRLLPVAACKVLLQLPSHRCFPCAVAG